MRAPDLDALARARADARAWLATMPDLSTASDEQLLTWLDTYPPRIAASMKRLLHFSALAATPRGLLDRFLGRPDIPAGLANRIVGGTGDVDSALLPQRMWSLGRVVAADPALSAMFDEGLDGVAERTAGTPLQVAVDDFLAEHGHRGPDEYELATPAWIMDPTPIYAAVDRLRHAPASRDPAIVAGSARRGCRRRARRGRDAAATTPAPDDSQVRDGGPAGLDRTRAGQGHPRPREPRCSPRAARTRTSGCRARRSGGRRPGLLRHGVGTGSIRRPAGRFRRRDRSSRRAPALPRRTHPPVLVRGAHHRSGHLGAAGRLPSIRSRSPGRPSRASP